MNVLFVYYVPSGGVETLNRQRSLALKKWNIHSHFLYYEKRRQLINEHHAPVFITNEDDEIKKILEQGNYSAIIVVSDFSAAPRLRSLGYQGKIIIEIQGYGPKDVARTVLQKAVPTVTKYADGLLNPKTPHIEQFFSEFYLSIPKFSFNNCFDSNKFTYRSLPCSKHPIIAWIGRIEDNKNWREFIRIGNQLITKHNPDIQLLMFEDPTISIPEERNKFNRLIQHLNLEKNLSLKANVSNDEMAKHMSIIGDSGGFLCSTSKVEGAPYSILEAMSCKCPVLTTDSDGVRSSIIHNQTGKYYPIGNIATAVKEANELMNNQSLRDHIRTNALKHVKEHFSPDQYAHNFINMLASLGIDMNEITNSNTRDKE
ncbi:glycosyltransferase family 4 protein [Halalkalibacterium halodurans]|uniref:Glycosyl transferase family 1 n=1 Tax=Halalkalibacterium halodurans TaxID=86665 RepID=A0A0M0KH49_ALKHA|nr:glycosyltransferase [Halalkalibacterium halodurans]MED4164645.1 glycosyltransferase [Halalkalibacterium halodurans]TPE68334.1 glycosyltransferase [Halalkalibacterium halodurans]